MIAGAINNHGAVVQEAAEMIAGAINNHGAVVREAAGTVAAAINSHRAAVRTSASSIGDVLREEGRENRCVLREEGEENRCALRKEGEMTRRALREEGEMIRREIRTARAATSPPSRATSEVPHGIGNSMSPGTGVVREGEPSTAETSLGTGGTGNSVPVGQGLRTAEGEEQRPSELASTDSSGRTTAQKKRGKAAKRPQFPNDRPLFGNKSS
ncbi:hypothetical protein KC356_g4190 [Hortaea werneckii]|nr:hypothetical protein KC356_g4190 [Hortaea werneckii]